MHKIIGQVPIHVLKWHLKKIKLKIFCNFSKIDSIFQYSTNTKNGPSNLTEFNNMKGLEGNEVISPPDLTF